MANSSFFAAWAFLVLILVFGNGPKIVEASFLDDIGDVFKVITKVSCPTEHLKEFDVCHSLAFPFYGLQASLENDRAKINCCSRLAANDCMTLFTKFYCGEMTSEFVTLITKILDGIASGGECNAYSYITQCTHPALLALEFGIIIIIITAVLKGIWLCLCGLCKVNRNYERVYL